MNVFQSLDRSSSEAKDISEKYLKASHKYLKLKIFQQLTLSLSLIIKFFAIGSFLFLAFLFLSITAAIAIGHAIDSLMMGCLSVAVILILLAIIIYFRRKAIERIVIKTIAIKFFD